MNYLVILDWHEWAYGVGPVALVLLVAGGAVFLLRSFIAGTWRRPIGGLVLAVAIVLVMAIPIALNVYTPGWNAFLKGLPVIGESVTLARWFVLFIPLAVLGAALAVDRLAPSTAWAGGLFLVVAIATVWWHAAEPTQVPSSYHGAPIEQRMARGARQWHPADHRDQGPVADERGAGRHRPQQCDGRRDFRTLLLSADVRLSARGLSEDESADRTDPDADGRRRAELHEPELLSLPAREPLRLRGQFREDQKAALLDFAAYRALPFARSAIQTAADWTNLIALIGAALAVLVALPWRRRRSGTDATPTA